MNECDESNGDHESDQIIAHAHYGYTATGHDPQRVATAGRIVPAMGLGPSLAGKCGVGVGRA